jgi:hypothetical protein
MIVNQLVNENVEVGFVVKEIEHRIDKETSEQELLMWKFIEIDHLVNSVVKEQLEKGEFQPVVVAKMQLRWMRLKQQAIKELELRGIMEVYSRVQ